MTTFSTSSTATSIVWDAVTTRRLAERIEYSQPVLYSHFAGKGEIVRAVALDGFAELTDALRRANPPAAAPARIAVRALTRAGRLAAGRTDQRLDTLTDRLIGLR